MTSFKKLILPEFNNKLLLVTSSLPRENLIFTSNFSLKTTKQFKLIKNVIFFELFSNRRPKISASLYNKQLIVRLSTVTEVSNQIFLQKNPVPWKNYLESFNFNKFSRLSLLPNLEINCKSQNKSYRSILVKSAYLD